MRRFRLVLVTGPVLLVACLPSLHPFFTDDDVVFEPALLGTWEFGQNEWIVSEVLRGKYQLGGDDACTFSEAPDDRGYTVSCTGNGETYGFEVHLFRLDDRLFLDLKPQKNRERDFHSIHFVRAHSVARVWLEGDLLRLGILSGEWVDALIEEKVLKIAHERTDGGFFNSPVGGVLLTASTKDLRKFLLKYADDPRAFPKPDECTVTVGVRTGCVALWGNPP